jgi:hypothetical protein
MRKIFFYTFTALVMVSCGNDDDDDGNQNTGYPTDNLSLKDEKKVLIFTNYAPFSASSIDNKKDEAIGNQAFGDDFNWVNLVAPPAPLTSQASIDLLTAFNLSSANGLNLNGLDYSNNDMLIEDVASRFEKGRPVASVSHKVTKNDTAWLIDCKVKFWKDTLAANRFKIESYFLADIPAYNYKSLGVDLRMALVPNVIDQGDSISSWAVSVSNLDSTAQVIRVGDEYVHTNIMFDKATPDSLFGNPISSYTPFGFQYFENDVVGTRSTPIRHFFLRPDRDDITTNDIEFIYTPVFLTVIWSEDPITGAVDYLNSFISRSTP